MDLNIHVGRYSGACQKTYKSLGRRIILTRFIRPITPRETGPNLRFGFQDRVQRLDVKSNIIKQGAGDVYAQILDATGSGQGECSLISGGGTRVYWEDLGFGPVYCASRS